jgi:hypothetical protein
MGMDDGFDMTSSTSIAEQFSARVEAFLVASEMAQTRLGRDALNDPNFVEDMRNGRSFNSDTMDTVLDFIARWEREHKKLRVA